MPDFPRSLVEFQRRFPDEAACVAYLFTARWPQRGKRAGERGRDAHYWAPPRTTPYKQLI